MSQKCQIGDILPSRITPAATTSMALTFRWRSRPQHQLRTSNFGCLRVTTSVAHLGACRSHRGSSRTAHRLVRSRRTGPRAWAAGLSRRGALPAASETSTAERLPTRLGWRALFPTLSLRQRSRPTDATARARPACTRSRAHSANHKPKSISALRFAYNSTRLPRYRVELARAFRYLSRLTARTRLNARQ